MYKIVVTPVRTGKEEVIFAEDFEATSDRLLITNVRAGSKDNLLVFMLHSVESFYVEKHLEED